MDILHLSIIRNRNGLFSRNAAEEKEKNFLLLSELISKRLRDYTWYMHYALTHIDQVLLSTSVTEITEILGHGRTSLFSGRSYQDGRGEGIPSRILPMCLQSGKQLQQSQRDCGDDTFQRKVCLSKREGSVRVPVTRKILF